MYSFHSFYYFICNRNEEHQVHLPFQIRQHLVHKQVRFQIRPGSSMTQGFHHTTHRRKINTPKHWFSFKNAWYYYFYRYNKLVINLLGSCRLSVQIKSINEMNEKVVFFPTSSLIKMYIYNNNLYQADLSISFLQKTKKIDLKNYDCNLKSNETLCN